MTIQAGLELSHQARGDLYGENVAAKEEISDDQMNSSD